ncbi:MAG: glycosyltransferase family 39 protein, partial [Chloroflexota bacterium]
VNLLGAVCAALTLAVLARLVRRLTGSAGASLAAVAALGLSATFWTQGTVANIRSLTALLTALCLALLLSWGESRRPGRLTAFAACFGLAVGHHSSLALLGLPFLAYILTTDPRLPLQPRRWLAPLGALLLSLLVLLYLPLRSLMNPPFDPAPIRSWGGFWSHVLAQGFRGDMLHYRTLPELAARLGAWAQIMRLEFGPVVPWVALVALTRLASRRWRWALLLAGVWAVNTLTAITYRAPQTVEYLMPSYVALAAILGGGLGLLRRRGGKQRILYACLAGLLMPGVALYAWPNGASFARLHRDTSARDYATAILRDAPPEAVILSSWHRATPFWYLQQVEGLRSDVTVRYVYPEGAEPNDQVWLRHIAAESAARPVIVTNRYHAYDGAPYRWVPFHGAWLVAPAPLREPIGRITPLAATFEEGIELLGYELDQAELAPGDMLSLRVFWRPTIALDRDYSSFVQLLGPRGVVGQGDIVQASRTYAPGEVRVDAYRFSLLPHTPPGEYGLVTGFYHASGDSWRRLTADGAEQVRLTRLRVAARTQRLPTTHPLWQRSSRGLELYGFEVDRSVPKQMRLYLHWWQPASVSLPPPWPPRTRSAMTVQAHFAGRVLAQAELPALAPRSGLTVALDVPSDAPWVTLRLVDASGQGVDWLGPWHRPTASYRLTLPRGAQSYVPLGGEMAFLGLSRPPSRAAPGQRVILRPQFLALRPLSEDYSVSVGILAGEGQGEWKADGTPVLGAIPTLKWVQGWRIDDRHTVALAADAPLGPAQLTLSVYDVFTLHPLHVLDERLVRAGQGTALNVGQVRIQEPSRPSRPR